MLWPRLWYNPSSRWRPPPTAGVIGCMSTTHTLGDFINYETPEAAKALSDQLLEMRSSYAPATRLQFRSSAYSLAEDSSSSYISGFVTTLQMATASTDGCGVSVQYV